MLMQFLPTMWILVVGMCIAYRVRNIAVIIGIALVVGYIAVSYPEYVLVTALVLTIAWVIVCVVDLLTGVQPSDQTDNTRTGESRIQKQKYRPDIDGLRAYAIIPVVVYHAFPTVMPGGFIGVDVFFVISGFLITQILIEQNAAGTFSYAGFYERRVRRIFPALAVVLGAVLVAGWFLLFTDEYQNLATHSIAGSLFTSNLLLYNQVGYFATDSYALPLLHLWSLGVEEQFYIVWPIVVTALHRHRNRLLWAFIGLVVVSFVSTQYVQMTDGDAAFYWPITRFWELGIGGIAAWLVSTYQIAYHEPHARKTANALGWGGLLVFCIGLAAIDDTTVFPGYHALIPTVSAFMLIMAGGVSWVSRTLLANRLVVFVGLISYPLYLWHWPILSFGMIYYGGDFSTTFRLFAVVLAFVLAFLTYWGIERRVRVVSGNRSQISTRQIIVLLSCVVSISVLYVLNPVATPNASRQKNHRAKQVTVQVAATTEILTCQDAGFATSFKGICRVVLHPDSERTEYMIVGDSIARSLGLGLLDRAIDHPVVMLAKDGCAPLPGMERIRPASTATFGCTDANRVPAMYTAMTQNTENKQRVIFVSGLYTAIEGKKLNPLEKREIRLQYRDRPLPVTPEQRARDYRDSVIEMFDALSNIPSTTVVFVYQPPAFLNHPNSCIRRSLDGGAWGCPVPREVEDAFNAQYRAIVDDVLRDYPQIETFDPMQFLCDASFCYAAKDGQILYRDDTHLNILGSQLLAREIAKRYP